ncbi:CAP domain-containing protein [Xylariales sp. PMI_506]|nr:CAP domain-containing protein [Xylariales sp. PMI_506]
MTVSPSAPSTTAVTTTSSVPSPIVTGEAYIDTILRHHNVHCAKHTVPSLTWSPSLAETAMLIASSCVFQHDTSVNGGGYGQNIVAGFPSTAMGFAFTKDYYNGEVDSYTYYGGEPNINTASAWGHFSQIVWRSTTQVGCYTYDCSPKGGLQNSILPPYYTVCNYLPAGKILKCQIFSSETWFTT